VEFGEFVEEEHAVMRERNLARSRAQAAADQRLILLATFRSVSGMPMAVSPLPSARLEAVRWGVWQSTGQPGG
jgi:hypothetical protein